MIFAACVACRGCVGLAAVYRLYAKFGWTDSVYNHTSVRIPGSEQYLINALGLNYEEITASSFIKVDLDGKVIHPGVLGDLMGVNTAGLVIHAAIHAAYPHLIAVSHTHQIAVAGLSATKEGVLPFSQNAQLVGPISYHDYEGIAVNTEERKRLVKDMGDTNVMILRNHGILTTGKSVSQAFILMYLMAKTCEIQSHACTIAMTRDQLIVPSDEMVQRTYGLVKNSGFDGTLELCAYMRLLDKEDMSYRN